MPNHAKQGLVVLFILMSSHANHSNRVTSYLGSKVQPCYFILGLVVHLSLLIMHDELSKCFKVKASMSNRALIVPIVPYAISSHSTYCGQVNINAFHTYLFDQCQQNFLNCICLKTSKTFQIVDQAFLFGTFEEKTKV